MALVKTTKIAPGKAKAPAPVAKVVPPETARLTVPNRTAPGKATITERVAVATEQLASGITQSSATAEELRRSMEQIAHVGAGTQIGRG